MTREMEEKQCEHCGVMFTAPRHFPPRKFCERACQEKHVVYLRGLERAAARAIDAKMPKTYRGKQFQIHGDDSPVVLRSEVKYSNDKFSDEGLIAELEKIGAELGAKRWRKGSPGWWRLQKEAA
jgi:hypothetical protein